MKSDFSEALILFKTGKLNEAKNICEKILKEEKNNSQVYNLYAFVLYYLEKFDAFDYKPTFRRKELNLKTLFFVLIFHPIIINRFIFPNTTLLYNQSI